MMQKVIKVGNSVAVTLPKHFIDQAKWKTGQDVFVEIDPEEEVVTIQKKKSSPIKKHAITPEFYEWLKSFNARYKDALTELAQK